MFAICVFGDSLVFGRGDNKDRGWVGRLRKYVETKDYYNAVYNLGVPGDSTSELLERFETECKARTQKYWPGDNSVIMIGIGANDSRAVDTPENVQTMPTIFEGNISRLIKESKKYADKIVLIGLMPVDEQITNPYEATFFNNKCIEKYNKILKKSCIKEKVLFIDIFDKFKGLNYVKLLDDGLHPNAKGYEKMYEIIKESLVKHKIIN